MRTQRRKGAKAREKYREEGCKRAEALFAIEWRLRGNLARQYHTDDDVNWTVRAYCRSEAQRDRLLSRYERFSSAFEYRVRTLALTTSAAKPVRKCKICGCTDERACVGGCEWADRDLCSRCYEGLKECVREGWV